MNTKRIIFMGSPHFALPSLQTLIDSEHEVIAVYSQPPRPAGRGKKLTPTPVQQLAQLNDIPVYTPEKLTKEESEKLATQKPDLICVAAYGLILPQHVLDIAPCLNVHPSALPRWRGAAPIQHTILNGDTTTDLCIMQMEKGLDTGPVYSRTAYPISGNETTGELHDRMAKLGGDHLLEVINNWPVSSIPQGEEGTTYAHKITKDMCPINWQNSAQEIHNHIRGLSPFPAATTKYKDEILKIQNSVLLDENTSKPAGTIIQSAQSGVTVACGDGKVVSLQTLQRAGKKPQPVHEFLQGYKLEGTFE